MVKRPCRTRQTPIGSPNIPQQYPPKVWWIFIPAAFARKSSRWGTSFCSKVDFWGAFWAKFPFFFLKLDVFVFFHWEGMGTRIGENLGSDFQFFGELAGRIDQDLYNLSVAVVSQWIFSIEFN